MDIIKWITDNYMQIFAIAGFIHLAATGIVALTPSTKDDELLGKIVTFIERFSFIYKKTTPPNVK